MFWLRSRKVNLLDLNNMTEKTLVNRLEGFIEKANTVKGEEAVKLIQQVLDHPGIFVFGELLDSPNIQQLEHDEQTAPYFRLFNLFAYGTYNDYKEQKDKLPEITNFQLLKLRHLTLVSIATKQKCIPYTLLSKELDLPNLRDLEDLIIEAIYAGIIKGKLDQKNKQLEVDYAIGRDIRSEAIPEIISVLQEWCNSCDAVLKGIETQIVKANKLKEKKLKTKLQIENEVANVKKSLKSTQQDLDEQMVTDSREVPVSGEKGGKKLTKIKGFHYI
ncbi:COP9 signalosome complex subunit 7b isoform X2 [Octopus bimaculoides]|uniref:COP9 signalosome complex subunit 7b isoform X2 n=1 Tax=Octopus sinensis TaxID=2607531 RepID=A0A6P7SBT3_9MOLL|nr:COP9 signalosome complex subunit 7b isoform X2 [Octopus sinensis]XP_052823161.1 COP9 signalosome complex subunit 7b isoform X2 [Octopus bimaculoides]